MEKKRNTVELVVEGPRALFSDPITRVGGEKTSYYVPTYEALKGVVSSVYWKPTFIWVIDAVRIMNPIQTSSEGIRTKNYNGGNDLSLYTYLRNVRYQIRAHFVWNENRPELAADRIEHKHHNIAKRMIERGGRRDIFLGTRECQAYAAPCVFGEETGAYDSIDEFALGFMLHGITYADEATLPQEKGRMTLRFFRPVMRRGIIDFPCPEEIPETDKRLLHNIAIKKFGEKYQNFSGLSEFNEEIEL